MVSEEIIRDDFSNPWFWRITGNVVWRNNPRRQSDLALKLRTEPPSSNERCAFLPHPVPSLPHSPKHKWQHWNLSPKMSKLLSKAITWEKEKTWMYLEVQLFGYMTVKTVWHSIRRVIYRIVELNEIWPTKCLAPCSAHTGAPWMLEYCQMQLHFSTSVFLPSLGNISLVYKLYKRKSKLFLKFKLQSVWWNSVVYVGSTMRV